MTEKDKEQMPRHTPGPWSTASGRKRFYVNDALGNRVCDITPWTPQIDLADARLIAAAPEMLEALRYLVAECDPNMDDDYNPHAAPLKLARAAIAKATGEQS